MLNSFYVSTKPLGLYDTASVVYCGWTIADQLKEGRPTWCDYTTFSGNGTILRKVEVNRKDLAYVSFGGILNFVPGDLTGDAAKGSRPVEFQLDDVSVCVLDN